MDAVIPWDRLLALIDPRYPKAGNGTQPKPMQQMLRSYLMQTWFNRGKRARQYSDVETAARREARSVRRPGLLERVASAGGVGEGSPLPDQSPAESSSVDPISALDKATASHRVSPRGTYLPRNQATLGVQLSLLSRFVEGHCGPVHQLCARRSLSAETKLLPTHWS
jgi:hypothetical protein